MRFDAVIPLVDGMIFISSVAPNYYYIVAGLKSGHGRFG
jgi:hypothetical protein